MRRIYFIKLLMGLGILTLFSTSCETENNKSIEDPALQTEGAPLIGVEGVQTYCEDWSLLTDGIYKFENNVWGKTEEFPYQQCLLQRNVNGRTENGWSWYWTGKAPNWVFSYPEIIVGWKPWGESLPTDPIYPIKISEIDKFSISYDIEINAKGGYNLAPEIWIIGEKPDAFPKEKPEQLITSEIMFWMDYSPGSKPAGTREEDFEFGGNEYELWYKKDHQNSGDTVSWSIISLVSKNKQHKGTIDVAGLLNKLIELGYGITEDEYIASIEFGTEIFGRKPTDRSSGFLWVKDYSVELETL